MFCPKCGTQIHEASQFCVKCGARLSDLGVGGSAECAAAATPAMSTVGTTRSAPIAGLYAGFWRRVAASIIDSIVLIVGSVPFAIMVAGSGADEDEAAGTAYLLSVVLAWLYSALMESSGRQATLGKIALGIKVTDMNGERIGFGRATGRHFAKIISSITLGIGFAKAGFTKRRQGLHDMIAGTLVVNGQTSAQQLALHPSAPPVSGWGVALIVLVVAAVPMTGILAAIAIPAYQDYTIRAQVSEGLISAAAYKATVAEAVASGADWEDITSEGLNLDTQAPSKYLQSVEVVMGAVALTFGDQANSNIAGDRLVLVPGVSPGGDVVWVCGYGAAPDGVELVIEDHEQYTDVEAKYLPAACRS